MICALIAWAVGAVCVGVCGGRLLRMRTKAHEAEQLLEELRRSARSGRPFSESESASRLLPALVKASTHDALVAEFNEVLADVSRELDVGAALPASAGRIALMTGTLLAVIELIRSLPETGPSIGWALGAFCGGAAVALSAGLMGRVSDREAARSRAAWNEIGRELSPRSGPA